MIIILSGNKRKIQNMANLLIVLKSQNRQTTEREIKSNRFEI